MDWFFTATSLSTPLDWLLQKAYRYLPAMQIAMYSSLSGGGRVGNGACEEMFLEGVVTSCNSASTSGCWSPAKADAAGVLGDSTCLDKGLEDLRSCPSLPALNHIQDRRAQAVTKPKTRFSR